MKWPKLILGPVVVLSATSVGAAGKLIVHRGMTRPPCRTAIPAEDYQYRNRSRSLTAISQTAILARGSAQDTERFITDARKVAEQTLSAEDGWRLLDPNAHSTTLFQLKESRLRINHCELSRVALLLDDQGRWLFSARGDQNLVHPDDPATYRPRLHLRRNEFVVYLRCYGGFGNTRQALEQEAGQPMLAELGPFEFWVENGQPRYFRDEGCCRALQDRLPLIDRLEIEFFYREGSFDRANPR